MDVPQNDPWVTPFMKAHYWKGMTLAQYLIPGVFLLSDGWIKAFNTKYAIKGKNHFHIVGRSDTYLKWAFNQWRLTYQGHLTVALPAVLFVAIDVHFLSNIESGYQTNSTNKKEVRRLQTLNFVVSSVCFLAIFHELQI